MLKFNIRSYFDVCRFPHDTYEKNTCNKNDTTDFYPSKQISNLIYYNNFYNKRHCNCQILTLLIQTYPLDQRCIIIKRSTRSHIHPEHDES